jgi:hypothetical protein
MVLVSLGVIVLLLTHPVYALNQVSASIDKNPVMINESFVLEVIADDEVSANALDTTQLMKDFIVGRTSVSSQTSMVNFNTTRTTRWTTVLIARKAGNYIIPRLSVDGIATTPIKLNVLALSDPQASKQQDLFITSEISATSVYVQQQLTLTVKLHFSTELKRGSLSEPTLAGANIKQIGKDQESDNIINGRRYRVIERVYSLSPQQSGDFILKSPVFSGEIMMQSNRRSNFLSFGETKPVSVIGDDIALTIKPIPSNYQGAWLPSELLSIHQEWQPDVNNNNADKNQFKVGEPITRTITLTAAGLSEEQLPEITMTMPSGIKVYPDQAELHTGMNSNKLVSQKVRNFAVVPSKVGTFILPEITIPWWNTVTNKYQEAKIPAQTINVIANPEIENDNDFRDSSSHNQTNDTLVKTQTTIVKEASWLQWLFLGLWLLTSLAWFVTARLNKKIAPSNINKANIRNKTRHASNRSTNATQQDPYLAILAACKTNQGQTVLSLIVPWLNQFNKKQQTKKAHSKTNYNVVASIDEALTELNDAQFSTLITELQQCYFGKSEHEWQGNELFSFIQKLNKMQSPKDNQVALSLNP